MHKPHATQEKCPSPQSCAPHKLHPIMFTLPNHPRTIPSSEYASRPSRTEITAPSILTVPTPYNCQQKFKLCHREEARHKQVSITISVINLIDDPISVISADFRGRPYSTHYNGNQKFARIAHCLLDEKAALCQHQSIVIQFFMHSKFITFSLT